MVGMDCVWKPIQSTGQDTVIGAVVGASRMEEMEFSFGRRKEDLQIRLVAGSTYDDAVLGGIVRTGTA